MALATPLVTVQDGASSAQSPAANATAFVTPGNSVLVTLASTVGVTQAEWTLSAPGTTLDGQKFRWVPANGPAAFAFQAPLGPVVITVTTEVTDGNNPTTNTNSLQSLLRSAGGMHTARGVSAANNESLTAFVGVTGGTPRDGVTYVQGDIVLLTGQATKSQNGLYVVGVVAAGTAPLSRIPEFATGLVFSKSQVQFCELGPEGTLFGGTLWKITTTGPITVDTTNHDWFPRQVAQSVTLVAGTTTITNVPILSATKTAITSDRTTANTSTATTGGYHPVGAMTPGIVGTASLTFDATVAAGTINNADVSTLTVLITNF